MKRQRGRSDDIDGGKTPDNSSYSTYIFSEETSQATSSSRRACQCSCHACCE